MSFAPWVAQPPTFCAHTTFGYFIFPLPAYAHDFNPDPDAAGRRGDRCRLRVTQAKKSEAENSHRLSLSYLSPSRPEFSFFSTWCLSRLKGQPSVPLMIFLYIYILFFTTYFSYFHIYLFHSAASACVSCLILCLSSGPVYMLISCFLLQRPSLSTALEATPPSSTSSSSLYSGAVVIW